MLLGFAVGKPGSWESGIKVLFNVDGSSGGRPWIESISDPKLWIAATSQVLMSLHISCGLTLTLSSRSRNHGHIFR